MEQYSNRSRALHKPVERDLTDPEVNIPTLHALQPNAAWYPHAPRAAIPNRRNTDRVEVTVQVFNFDLDNLAARYHYLSR